MSDSLGTTVTGFLKLRAKITKKNKEVDELKKQASEIESIIIKELEQNKTTRADVMLGSVTLKPKNVFSAKDWKKIYAYIIKKKDFNILQKRLGQTALDEYLEDGVKIPGVEKMIKKSLSVGWKKRA